MKATFAGNGSLPSARLTSMLTALSTTCAFVRIRRPSMITPEPPKFSIPLVCQGIVKSGASLSTLKLTTLDAIEGWSWVCPL